MPPDATANSSPPPGPIRKARWSKLDYVVRGVVGGLLLYLLVAYLVLPLAWRRYEKRHPAIAKPQERRLRGNMLTIHGGFDMAPNA